MAFLDNSGDIILDAVLTDTGRFRLAKGDGSFKIVKYAFADDEIDYSQYNKDHASGSAYYDLDILKTPVLEAFTNNTANMKHRLMSIPRTNLLYLPTVKLVETQPPGEPKVAGRNATAGQAKDHYVVCVDQTTEDKFFGNTENGTSDPGESVRVGVLRGPNNTGERCIVVDQGLNTTEISHKFSLDPDLRETRYIIEIDNRFGSITNEAGSVQTPNFIDDDHIASYSFTETNTNVYSINSKSTAADASPVISGPRGTRLVFSLKPSIELNSSTFLFTKLGTSSVSWTNLAGVTFRQIDTIVRVTGASTGRSLDIPVRFIKRQTG